MMFKKPSKKARKSRSTKAQKGTLDKWFSRYIRLRDMLGNNFVSYREGCNADGICRCYTCGKMVPILDIHCGHFMPRTYLATRYDEQNCHAQCCSCNTFAEGEHFIYGDLIDEEYGRGTAKRLYYKAKNGRGMKLTQFEYEQMIDHYKKEVKRLGGDRYWNNKKKGQSC